MQRFDLLLGDYVSCVDAVVEDGAIQCAILACNRGVKAQELISAGAQAWLVEVPEDYVANSLSGSSGTHATLKIVSNDGQI